MTWLRLNSCLVSKNEFLAKETTTFTQLVNIIFKWAFTILCPSFFDTSHQFSSFRILNDSQTFCKLNRLKKIGMLLHKEFHPIVKQQIMMRRSSFIHPSCFYKTRLKLKIVAKKLISKSVSLVISSTVSQKFKIDITFC